MRYFPCLGFLVLQQWTVSPIIEGNINYFVSIFLSILNTCSLPCRWRVCNKWYIIIGHPTLGRWDGSSLFATRAGPYQWLHLEAKWPNGAHGKQAYSIQRMRKHLVPSEPCDWLLGKVSWVGKAVKCNKLRTGNGWSGNRAEEGSISSCRGVRKYISGQNKGTHN